MVNVCSNLINQAQQQLQLLIVNYNKQLQLGLIRPLPSWPSPSSQSSTSQSADPSGSGGASPAPGHHEAEAEDNAQNAELRRSRRYELLAQLLNACFGGESVFPGQLPQNAASVPIPLSVILATALKQLTRGELFVKREQVSCQSNAEFFFRPSCLRGSPLFTCVRALCISRLEFWSAANLELSSLFAILGRPGAEPVSGARARTAFRVRPLLSRPSSHSAPGATRAVPAAVEF